MKSEPTPTVVRLSWDEVHRLEVNLRARAARLGRAVGQCPGCGEKIAATGDHLRVGGVSVHHSCVFSCAE